MNLSLNQTLLNFSVRVYLLLIQKDSITHMHGPAVYVKEGLPFAWGLSRNSWFMVTWFILYLWFIKLETWWILDNRNVSPYLQYTVWHLQHTKLQEDWRSPFLRLVWVSRGRYWKMTFKYFLELKLVSCFWK